MSYFDDHEDRIIYGSVTRRGARCDHCGSTAVKWRLTDAGWRLFDQQRVHPGNYKPLHNCRAHGAASADEFDIVTPTPTKD